VNYQAPRYLFRRYELLRRLQPGKTFMEIGAGNLALTRELLANFEHGLAVDFTDDLAVSYSALPNELQARLDTLNANIMTEAIPEKFDCVVACEVMEHIENDRLFMVKISECLVTGGQAIITVPAKSEYWSIHDELVGHLRRYEKTELTALASESGFADIKIIAYGYPWINWLSVLRVWLARRNMTDRQSWDQEKQTSMSNHRQIPTWLSGSIIPLILNKFTVYPFALVSRLFGNRDLSDGYILTMRKQ
jgi:SAM-dependent methyltransferase